MDDERLRQHEDQLTLLITLSVRMVTAIESLSASLATLTDLLSRLHQEER